MTETDLHAFRLNLRVALIERLALVRALTEPVTSGQLAMGESLKVLSEWLDTNAASVAKLLGAHFQEPGQTALYSEETTDVANEMKAILVKVAQAYPRRH